jgi:hypothetical protein
VRRTARRGAMRPHAPGDRAHFLPRAKRVRLSQ